MSTIYSTQTVAQRFFAIAIVALGLTAVEFVFRDNPAWGADHFDCFDAARCGSRSLSSSAVCLRNRDYTITNTPRNSQVVVLSIHGGEIEPMTSTITQMLSNQYGWSRYDFKAHGTAQCLEQRSNFETLHITAARFDDPDAIALVSRHLKAISIHGAGDLLRETICVGGRNQAQIQAFIKFIQHHQDKSPYLLQPINAPKSDDKACTALRGIDPLNIVNRNAHRAGLQLELSRSMRQDLVKQTAEAQALRQVVYGAINAAISIQ